MNAQRFIQMLSVLFFLAGVSFIPAKAHAQGEKPEYYPNGTYEANIPPPESVLGFPVGERPARYEEAVRYLKTLAEKSTRVKLEEMGSTYESRKQYCLILTSEENQKRLEEIRLNIVRLAHPAKLSEASARGLIDSNPAVAWIGYGIHGDELSSVDASLQLAYQLAAGADSATLKIIRELVVCVDPMENPDGRERFLSQLQQWAGQLLNSDGQSMAHGAWPYGRGNHYLFDMNRDWITLTQLENQARIRTIVKWDPQLLIDSHEMGSYDTYLFYPPRQPINPNVGDQIKKWWKVFSADQARAFDHYGWSYYTREWSDEWFPGYGSSWALYTDAVGILYEQAGTDGSLVKRPDGSSLTFREAVHHHFVSSIANLTTAANNRRGLLGDFWKAKVNGVVAGGKGDPRTFYLVPGKNATRVERLVEKLLLQDIEVKTLDRDFEAQDLHDYWGSKPASKTLPAGTYSVSLDQPMGRLAKAIMEFDPRMLSSSLEEERKALEKEGYSKMYDVTAWSLPISYGIEAYWSDRKENQAATPVQTLKPVAGGVQNPRPSYGFLFDYSDDRAVEALVMFFAKGYNIRCGKEPSEVEGRSFPRGTILLRVKENPKSLADDVKTIAEAAGIMIYGVNTALSTRGSDLGGNDFVLLRKPQIALIAGPEISTTSLGSLWHLLDYRLKYRISVLNSQQVNYTDLTKYNVIVLPSGGSRSYNQLLGKAGIGKIREWVSSGGTLIGLEGAAAFLADTASGFSDVRLKQQALKDLELYSKAVELEKKAGMPKIDSISVWEGKQPSKDTSKAEKAPAQNDKEIALQDERARLFMPRGAILKLELDAENWLNYGVGDKVPAILFTSDAMLSKEPVQTAARFSDSQHLRISGLLWPEARERWAKTAYATRESKGKGQIILFAGEPDFRACFPGTGRLLLNSLFLGPGFGTEHPVDW